MKKEIHDKETHNDKKGYRLIALDMDGTLLNSQKQISPYTREMIQRAVEAGKEVVLSTGRCIPELEETFAQLPELRYAICVSGSLLYDVRERKPILSYPLQPNLCNRILQEGRKEDVMVHFLGLKSIVQEDRLDCMDRYGMGIYTDMFRKVTSPVKDIYAYYEQYQMPLNKLNLYHATVEARARTMKRLSGLPLEMVFAEGLSLECSAIGVTKGNGLLDLCHYLGIPIGETIAVGDADNDLAILRTAGLAVAMGNANENVKAICPVEVADCDHDGCAEAIERYLL